MTLNIENLAKLGMISKLSLLLKADFQNLPSFLLARSPKIKLCLILITVSTLLTLLINNVK